MGMHVIHPPILRTILQGDGEQMHRAVSDSAVETDEHVEADLIGSEVAPIDALNVGRRSQRGVENNCEHQSNDTYERG